MFSVLHFGLSLNEKLIRVLIFLLKLFERLWSQGPAARKVAGQLFKCGTSIGANTAESQGGQTKPDFVAKPVIARKESWETIYWLKLAIAGTVLRLEAG